jgi:hypothetical protein
VSSSVPPAFTPDDYRRQLEEVKRDILSALPKQDPRSWRLLSVVLPIVLTSFFSLFVYRFQAGIADKVDRESKALQARLSLTQDYYRERLRIYQAIHQSVIGVKDKADATVGAIEDAGLDSSVEALYHSYANNSIFLTRELEDRLTDLWRSSLTVLRNDKITKTDKAEIVKAIAAVEAQMRRDLLIDELTQQKFIEPVQGAVPTPAGTATP